MKKNICFIILIISNIYGKVISGFNYPESVVLKDNTLYVSNVGKKLDVKKDSDGFISKLSKDGKIIDLHFIDNLNAPKGMVTIGEKIFIADVNSLKVYNLNTRKKIYSILFKGTKYLNDITIKNKNTLYISSTDLNAIFEVDLLKRTYKKLLSIKAPNGLFYENNILYIAKLGESIENILDSKGKLLSFDIKRNKLVTLGDFNGIFDGIQKFNNKIYISDWVNFRKSGVIRVYDLKTKKQTVLKEKAFYGCADFIIDKKTRKLYLPQMLGNSLKIIDL